MATTLTPCPGHLSSQSWTIASGSIRAACRTGMPPVYAPLVVSLRYRSAPRESSHRALRLQGDCRTSGAWLGPAGNRNISHPRWLQLLSPRVQASASSGVATKGDRDSPFRRSVRCPPATPFPKRMLSWCALYASLQEVSMLGRVLQLSHCQAIIAAPGAPADLQMSR